MTKLQALLEVLEEQKDTMGQISVCVWCVAWNAVRERLTLPTPKEGQK